MCKFQAIQIVEKKLSELDCKFIGYTLNDGTLKIKYNNIHGSEDEIVINYRYFTPERLNIKIIAEVEK